MNITEQIEEVENQIEYENERIASMEQQLSEYVGEPNKWYSACEFNLNKAELRKEHLEKKLKKLLTTQKELEMQQRAEILKEEKRRIAHERQIKLAEAQAVARQKAKDKKKLPLIELESRRLVEFRRLVQGILGDEKTFALADEAEKKAIEWMEKRKTPTPISSHTIEI